MRQLWTGDNLELLGSLDDATVGLVYLDPPFGSSRSYDAVLSTRRLTSGEHAVHAFDDRWPLDGAHTAEGAADIEQQSPGLGSLLRHVESVNPGLAGYLAMMAPRLLEARRVLHDRGSIYVHCDPAASHYLKAALDVVFGPQNFRNEIIWRRTHAHSSSRRYGPVHDVVLFYSRSSAYAWNPRHTPYDESYLSKHFRQSDAHGHYQLITCTAPGDRQGTRAHFEWRGQYPPPGRHWAWQRERMQELEDSGRLVYSKNGVPRLKRYVDDGPGLALQDLWLDIHRLDAHSDERVGYETQKPVALLDRIIAASTEPGDLVVDPFCGTGTTMVAAERLGRSWAGGDLSLLATSYALARVRQDAGREPIALHGFPASLAESRRLLTDDSATYGVWSAGMLATLVDRRALTETVAHGRGRLRHPRERTVDLMSWIPLARGAVDNESYDAGRHRALGLVVDNGRGAAALTRQLAERLPALSICQVEPSTLVSVAARRTGLVDDVVEWAGGVA